MKSPKSKTRPAIDSAARFFVGIKTLYAALLLAPVLLFGPAETGHAKYSTSVCRLAIVYQTNIDLAFEHAVAADGGQTLVTVQVQPSFLPEYAVTLKRTDSGVKLLRSSLPQQLFSHLPPQASPVTPQKCLELARATNIDTEILPLSRDEADALWTAFLKTKLQSAPCPRRKGKCTLLTDGLYYVVRTSDGRRIKLTETATLQNVESENPELLDWVHSVLEITKGSR